MVEHLQQIVSPSEGDPEQGALVADSLLRRAVEMSASDLHIESTRTGVRVKVRVDGILQQITDLPPHVGRRVISRLQILARVDISKKHVHQDGLLVVEIDGRELQLRVSSYASIYGPTLVLRLLDVRQSILPLERLGFAPRPFAALRAAVKRTSGFSRPGPPVPARRPPCSHSWTSCVARA